MLTIDRIHIRELRGIRDLCIEPNGDSFIVWGPNGSGKSGVVDALDFALTGDIVRLRGSGLGNVNLQRHGPHVHHRRNPGAAVVELKVTDPCSGKSACLSRSVSDPKSFTLDPDVLEVRNAIKRASLHPEMILTRREIIRYIVAEPGKRSTEIQALLRLERLGQIRKVLRTVQTKTNSASDSAVGRAGEAEDSLKQHFGIPKLLIDQIRDSVNCKRLILGLDKLPELHSDIDLSAGVASIDGTALTFNKSSAVTDIASACAAMDDLFTAVTESLDTLQSRITDIETYNGVHTAIASRALVQSGLNIVDGAVCPLCDAQWSDQAELEEHLQEKLRSSEHAASLDDARAAAAEATVDKLRSVVKVVINPLYKVGTGVGADEVKDRLDSVRAQLADASQHLPSLLRVEELHQLRSKVELTRAVVDETIKVVGSLVDERPDQSGAAAAHSFLMIAQERWSTLHRTQSAATAALAAAEAAKAVHDTYCEVLDTGLASIYEKVQKRFAELYRFLNAEDEEGFKANLSPSGNKLDLAVDFYGLGMFPPAAYHSEGHQDGMGICLYLALIKQVLGADFRLAVFDDVMMSVDVGHRRKFCSMLDSYFPDVQFIVTTHDEVWADQMVRSGLIKKKQQARFVAWNVNDGPSMRESSDDWERLREDLDRCDINAAAARLRRNMERSLAEIAENLSAPVTYRASGRWDLGEFLNAIKARYGRLLKRAAQAANSWNNKEAEAQVKAAQEKWQKAMSKLRSEKWAINPAVHYNEWENFGREDFEPVVKACRAFLEIFSCSRCKTFLHLSGQAGSASEMLRCECAHYQFNLVRK